MGDLCVLRPLPLIRQRREGSGGEGDAGRIEYQVLFTVLVMHWSSGGVEGDRGMCSFA